MVDEKILSRVQKLLALATSSNENEAQAAMLKAQELMMKHGLEMTDLESSETQQDREVVKEMGDDFISAPWKRQLVHIVADNFRCKSFFYNYKGKLRAVFMGLKEDAMVAKAVYAFALKDIDKGMYRTYRKFRDSGKDAKGVRGDYVTGYLKGLTEKFWEQIDKNSWGLVVVTPPEVTKEYDAMIFAQFKSNAKTSRQGNSEAAATGYSDGKSFGFGEQIEG